MKTVARLSDMTKLLSGEKKRRIAVAYAHDGASIEAVRTAVREGIVEGVLVGDKKTVEAACSQAGANPGEFTIVHEPDEKMSGVKAVQLVRDGKADILMKGLIGTPYYMKAMLDKEKGLLPAGNILSHVGVLEIPGMDRLLIVSDVAILPQPSLEQKVRMILYSVQVSKRLGIERPKVAVLAASEKVSDKLPSTVDAARLKEMGDGGRFGGAVVDGPLALDGALSEEACRVKGIKSAVGGSADVLIFPDIEAGNVFFKSATLLAKGKFAGIVAGASAPAVLTSRADSGESKFYSIVLAALMARGAGGKPPC